MKKLSVLALLLLVGAASLQAAVVLPESGRLAGPLNSARSAFGNEFLFFPAPLTYAGPGRTPQTGWLEIQFLPPEGNLVEFIMVVNSRGIEPAFEFVGGQIYPLTGETLIPGNSRGILNLETGDIEDIEVTVSFRNSLTADVGKLNRIAGQYGHTYPPDLSGLPLPPLPPGFTFADADFTYDTEGKITGFEFTGQSLGPIGAFGFAGFLPEYGFGPSLETYFPNPGFCLDTVPPENCSTDQNTPNGVELGFSSIMHPHTFLSTNELRPVPVDHEAPSCAPHARAEPVVVGVGGKIYQIGGTYRGRSRGRVDIYDPLAETWTRGPDLPTGVVEAQGDAIDSKIYVAGGRRFMNAAAADILQIYDTETGEWSQGARMPVGVADAAAAAFGGRLYVFGGLGNRANGSPGGNLKFVSNVQVYDPVSDTWEDRPGDFDDQPVYLAGASAISARDRILVLGGRTPQGTISDLALLYHALDETYELDSFFTGANLAWGVYDAAVARLGRRIYLVGGRTILEGPADERIQTLDPDLSLWRRAPEMIFPIAGSGAGVVNGRMYVVGGRSQGGADAFPGPVSGSVQALDVNRGWAACEDYPLYGAGDVFSMAALSAGNTNTMAPGSLATIDGTNMADGNFIANPAAPVPTTLGGISIDVDGEAAPILRVSPTRVDFQIPYGVKTNGTAEVTLHKDGLARQAPSIEIPMANASPTIFIQSCGGIRDRIRMHEAYALACQDNGTLNYASNTAQPFGVLEIQMTGLGAIDTPLANGQRAPANPAVAALDLPTVMVEGDDGLYYQATVLGASLAPGEVGIYDVRIVVPGNARQANRVLVEAEMNGITSNRASVAIGPYISGDPVPCLRDTNPLFRSCLRFSFFPGTPEVNSSN